MIKEAELNSIKGVMHYLNNTDSDLAFDVQIIDSSGDTLARIERVGLEYQLLFGDGFQ